MPIKFTKMHALGNDFMVIDGIREQFRLSKREIIALADRHRGIGFDQLLVVEPSRDIGVDFNYRIFNASGEEVGQCGNGARCLAVFVKEKQLTVKNTITVQTITTQLELEILEDGTVKTTMGIPKWNFPEIPFIGTPTPQPVTMAINDSSTSFYVTNVGNPHAVILVENVQNALVAEVGVILSKHPHFPQQTNVGFLQIVDEHHILLRVFERGCGETLACGSGAVAAVAVGRKYLNLANQVTVSQPGGNLLVEWNDCDSNISLTGPATLVYEGIVP